MLAQQSSVRHIVPNSNQVSKTFLISGSSYSTGLEEIIPKLFLIAITFGLFTEVCLDSISHAEGYIDTIAKTYCKSILNTKKGEGNHFVKFRSIARQVLGPATVS